MRAALMATRAVGSADLPTWESAVTAWPCEVRPVKGAPAQKYIALSVNADQPSFLTVRSSGGAVAMKLAW